MRALFSPITILLALCSLQWVALAEFGPFRLLLPYAALGMCALYALALPSARRAAVAYIGRNASWLAPLIIYVIMMTPILWGTPAQTFSPRQLFYAVGGCGLAAVIAASPNPSRLRIGGMLGLLILVGLIEMLAERIGLSWSDAFREFFLKGNLKFIIYDFLTAIFNSIDPSSDELFSASTKNEVANALIVVALLFRSGSAKPHRDWLGMVFISASLVLLVMLNDRSVLIAAAASLLIATALGALVRPISNAPLLVLKLAALLASMVVGIVILTSDTGLLGTLSARFSFGDASTAGRLNTYHGALAMIEKQPFFGNGYFEVDGLAIHNVFLNAWAYGGLIAFLLICCFYLVVLSRWISFMVTIARRPERWVLPIAVEWIAALPFLPLFRMWLSGEGGVMKFGEWMALSAFFGFILANELRRRAIHQPSSRATSGLAPGPSNFRRRGGYQPARSHSL